MGCFFVAAVGCSSSDGTGGEGGMAGTGADVEFPAEGPVSGEQGKGSFTFGAATAAAQIEESVPELDWYVWTAPPPNGLGMGDAFVGDAVRGYKLGVDDVTLASDTNLDAYRFSVNWARIEPSRDDIDQAALAHYDGVIDALTEAGIKPMITVHHFSSPVWVDDPRRDPVTPCTPSDTDLCGWNDEAGGALIIEELAQLGALLGQEYGDRVDEWVTVNEPINYFFSAYGTGSYPPGRGGVFDLLDPEAFQALLDTVERYAEAHAALYDAIKANDTVDADGDGVAAHVGYTLSVVDWVPGRNGESSDNPADIAAANNLRYVYHQVFTDAFVYGQWDANLDRTIDPSEERPEWEGKIDFLGVQYYFRAGATDSETFNIPLVNGFPCFAGLPVTEACIATEDPTKCIPEMQYEYFEDALSMILKEFGQLWPDLPMTVTESGLATEVGRRRSEHIVRSLEQILQARDAGVDVRGYYHWSLIDNFEWDLGFAPKFGLYTVDRESSNYARKPTEGATTLADIADARRLTASMIEELGGTGPMTPESPDAPAVNEFCQQTGL
jgi:beta-glucosidase